MRSRFDAVFQPQCSTLNRLRPERRLQLGLGKTVTNQQLNQTKGNEK
jgi:hypothetical protein